MDKYHVVRNGDYKKFCKHIEASCKPQAAKDYVNAFSCEVGDIITVWKLWQYYSAQSYRVYIMPDGTQSVLPHGI